MSEISLLSTGAEIARWAVLPRWAVFGKFPLLLGLILQNLNGRSVILDKFFFENDPLDDQPKKMLSSKKFYFFRKMVWSKTQNGDQHRIYPSLAI